MNIIDKFISFFSPDAGFKRELSRQRLQYLLGNRLRSEQYAAAKTSRLTGSWNPQYSNINDIIGSSLPKVRERVRQLVRDFPYLNRAINISVDYVVGSGIQFQSRVSDNAGNLDKTTINKIEYAFNNWMEKSDVSGKLHYYELMRLAKRQELENGEFLLIKRYIKDKSRQIPYCLQIIEGDWLTDIGNNSFNSSNIEIVNGVEYDKVTGKIIAYHFTDPDLWGKTTRVIAENVIHGFKPVRANQLRGIPEWANCIMLAHDLQDYMESELDASKMASKWLAVITEADPTMRQMQIAGIQAQGLDSDSMGRKLETMENAIIDYIRPGEDIKIMSNPRPGGGFGGFVKLLLTMFSTGTGIPYELLSGDYQGLNYSTSRMVRLDFAKTLMVIADRHIKQFCNPTFIPFLESAILSGQLDIRNYFSDPFKYQRANWQPPGMESVDPLRETKSKIDEITYGLRSPQEVVSARGREYEEVLKEIAESNRLLDEYGIQVGEVSTGMGNAPSEIGANEEDMNEDNNQDDSNRILKLR